jgi:hypothetical protein
MLPPSKNKIKAIMSIINKFTRHTLPLKNVKWKIIYHIQRVHMSCPFTKHTNHLRATVCKFLQCFVLSTSCHFQIYYYYCIFNAYLLHLIFVLFYDYKSKWEGFQTPFSLPLTLHHYTTGSQTFIPWTPLKMFYELNVPLHPNKFK